MTEFKLSDQHILGLMPEKGIKRLLGEALADPSLANGLPRVEVYFRDNNPEQFHERAIQSGMKELSTIQSRDWGDRVGYVLDPDGHVLAFAESKAIKVAPTQFLQPTLETARLTLSPFTENDLEDIFAYASHPEISKFVPWECHKTIEDSRNFFQFIQSSTCQLKGRLFFVFAIRLKETGRVIGSIDFKNPNPRCGQIDYALGFSYWNKGFATEATTKIRDWAFENFPELVRFQAFCVADNTGSRRVMEKTGMQFEGLRRKSFKLKSQMVDLADYSAIVE
jgi:ribosomal-protein-alanine N-acetyltransferase